METTAIIGTGDSEIVISTLEEIFGEMSLSGEMDTYDDLEDHHRWFLGSVDVYLSSYPEERELIVDGRHGWPGDFKVDIMHSPYNFEDAPYQENIAGIYERFKEKLGPTINAVWTRMAPNAAFYLLDHRHY